MAVLPEAFRAVPSEDARERAALARIRTEIADMDESGHHGNNAMRWTPDCPVLLWLIPREGTKTIDVNAELAARRTASWDRAEYRGKDGLD
ncbi:hypothetical protein, partial [Herbidospora yilanensis]|uniref:hypothetical protein n=1 Tax=Herbidospora yilanensis TaxID=354426 RepID=UPI0012F9D6BB